MRVPHRISRWFRTLSGRLFISHILVGVFTPLLIAALIALLALIVGFSFSPSDYAAYAEDAAILWLMPDSDAAQYIRDSWTTTYTPPGYSLIVTPDDRVVFTHGESSCTVGAELARCAPHFLDRPTGETLFTLGNETWVDVVLILQSGERVLARLASPTAENVSAWLNGALPEVLVAVLVVTLIVAVVSIPIGAILVSVFARPLLRRFERISATSQRFADGDLTARVLDPHQDEVSDLARQFDSMADVLQQNIYTLRHLLKSNAALTEQAEQAAIQSERLRLARDLHDELAQQLFSLSASSAAIPDLIARDATAAGEQARQVAALAEQTLVSLRSLLVDLRPGGLLDMGLVQGLKALCTAWEREHHIAVEHSVILSRERFSAPLQTAVFQIVRESLTNVAKHAQATQVNVTLVEGRQQLVVSISDNGKGLQPGDLHKNGHFGLVNIRERAEALGGKLYRESESGLGTTIRVVLPLPHIEPYTE